MRHKHANRRFHWCTALFLCCLALLVINGCYRPARMDMAPLLRPWQQTRATTPTAARAMAHSFKRVKVSALSPKQLVQHILQSNLRLRSLHRQSRLAQANAKEFNLVENPELRLQGFSAALGDGKVDQFRVRLRWRPPFPTIHAATKDRAIAMALANDQRLWHETYELLSRARSIYVDWLSLTRQITQAKALSQLKRQRWKWEQTRRKTGVSTALLVAAQRMAYIQQQQRYQQLLQMRRQRSHQLRQLLGVGGTCRPSPPANFDQPGAKRSSRKAHILQAIKRSPSLAIVRYQYRAHKAALWIETAKRIPWFTFFQASYQFGESPWPYGFFFGMGLELPVFNWNSAKINKEKRTLKALQEQARIQVHQIAMRITGSHKRWQQARRALLQARSMLQTHIAKSQTLLKRSPTSMAPPTQRWQLQEGILRLQAHMDQQITHYHRATIKLDQYSFAPIWTQFGLTPPWATKPTR